MGAGDEAGQAAGGAAGTTGDARASDWKSETGVTALDGASSASTRPFGPTRPEEAHYVKGLKGLMPSSVAIAARVEA